MKSFLQYVILVIAIVFVSGCKSRSILSTTMLTSSDLTGFSYRQNEISDATCVRADLYAKNLRDPSINIVQNVRQCRSTVIAEAEYETLSIAPFFPNAKVEVHVSPKSFGGADAAKVWCEDFAGVSATVGNTTTFQNQRCAVVVRYGRAILRFDVEGNSQIGYKPAISDLLKLVEDRVTILQELGKEI